MPKSMNAQPRKLDIYLLAGVATAPNFMEELRQALLHRLRSAGADVRAELLFPYGDWSRRLLPQLSEIRRDLVCREGRRRNSAGCEAAAEAIRATYRGGGLAVIGHSGGGVAGVHAVRLLRSWQQGERPRPVDGIEGAEAPGWRVIQIGSPKCAVPDDMRDSVMYAYAAKPGGRSIDPVTRLGTWGGWERGGGGIPRWNPRRYAPGVIVPVRIRGGHPDYFRSREPYIDEEGASNLEKMLELTVPWIERL